MNRIRGFTLVEMVMILVLVGILAAVAWPRMFDRTVFDARAFANQVEAILKYGQKIAIAQHRNVYVRLNGSSVALCFDNNFTSGCTSTKRVPAPSGNNSGSTVTLAACSNRKTWMCEGVPTGITTTTANFYFSPLGKPFNVTDVDPTTTFTSTLVISITGDGNTRNISVERETGYVHE